MVYLLWSVLNLAALAWFVFISFSVLKLIKDNMGSPALVIFILGSLSFIKDTISIKGSQPVTDQQLITATSIVNRDLLYSNTLSYYYPKDSGSTEMYGEVLQTGLVVGHAWKSLPPTFYFKNKKLYYSIRGNHEWKFLGLTLYSEPKEFKGQIK